MNEQLLRTDLCDPDEAITEAPFPTNEGKMPYLAPNHAITVDRNANSREPSLDILEGKNPYSGLESLCNGHDTPTTDENNHLEGQVPSMENHVRKDNASGQSCIAICGMAVRLPNDISTPQRLWQFLLSKGDARSRVPESRYNVQAFYDPSGKPGTVITEHGYFLNDDIGVLDTSFFSMPRMELERADPQQRLLLETTRECLEDAGETHWRGKRIGCYVGSLGEDWGEMFARETQNWGMYRASGSGDFALSNRVSYEMDFKGPRFARIHHVIM